ncbi:translation elongation factor Ts, partial [Candidatus Sumerlaeota bacterium]|nr:translation elongation factor Ts [Candidatus Sumerlaeota bacterium]
IFPLVSADGRVAVMLELNCETDFVARNEAFTKLGNEMVQHIAAGAAGTANNSVEEYLAAASPQNPAVPVSEIIRQNVATLGENIGIGRFVRHQAADSASHFQTYIHPPGKLGVLVEIRVGKEATKSAPEFIEYARDLAMHIAAAAPEFLYRSQVTPEKLEREKEIYREQAKNEGKADNLLDKIAQGKLGKFYSQVCLLEQEFVKNPDENIKKLTERVGKSLGDTITIARFERLKVGG